MAKDQEKGEGPADGVQVQICIECGKEYHFDGEPPPGMRCDKCGSVVFRSFFGETEPDEALEDFADTTGGDLSPSDPDAEPTRSDLHDLENS